MPPPTGHPPVIVQMYVAGLPIVTKAAIKTLPGKLQGDGNEWLLGNCYRAVSNYLADKECQYPRLSDVKECSGVIPPYAEKSLNGKPPGFPCPVSDEDRAKEARCRQEAEDVDEHDDD